jgi:hypothetical protein
MPRYHLDVDTLAQQQRRHGVPQGHEPGGVKCQPPPMARLDDGGIPLGLLARL